MPTYTFRNTDSGLIEEHKFSYKLLDEFKQNNPHLERHFASEDLPIFSDGSRMSVPGAGKADSTFEKYVINRIKESVPGNNLAKTHKTKMPREF